MRRGGEDATDAGREAARPTAPRWTPARIAVVYVLLGATWILLSDRVLEALVADPGSRATWQTLKGWGYVLTTGLLLLFLIRRSTEGVRQLDAEMRAAIDNMADAVLVVAPQGRVVDANPAAVELVGGSRREDLLLSVDAFASRFHLRRSDGTRLPPEGWPSSRALAGETLRGYEAMLRRTDGTDVFVGITASPVRLAPGRTPRLAVVVLRDISELKRFDEMRDEFLSTAAHEFKTPLAVVKAYAQLLKKRDQTEAATLEVIDRQVERLSRLVQQLLEVSRFRLGTPELRRERYDLAAQVAQAVEGFRDRAAGHRVRLEEREPAPVVADRQRIERVLLNLLDNAVRFSPGGGEVAARVRRRGGEVVVSVEDKGVGIPRDRQARIFERYYRAHAGTQNDYGGMGLGLDMSREIVSRHGGRMWFESEPGVGSTFSFSLPLAEGPADA